MNYYEHHIGDYAKDAGYLSMIEDGAFRRLLDAYYTREAPLPASAKDCCKLARASSKTERDAVVYVLGEFFDLREDGYHQKRCDEEIERYSDKQLDAGAKRENEAERQRRHRERRKQLFEALREFDIVPKYDTPTSELETLMSRVTSNNASLTCHRDTNGHITRDATATQSPVTRHQSRAEEREKPSGSKTSSRPSHPQLAIDTWLTSLGDGDAVPEDDPIWAYADQTGIPEEFVILAWETFASQMRDRGKRQRDWRAHFRNAVKRNWFKLWWFTATGACELTTAGVQAQRAAMSKEAA